MGTSSREDEGTSPPKGSFGEDGYVHKEDIGTSSREDEGTFLRFDMGDSPRGEKFTSPRGDC